MHLLSPSLPHFSIRSIDTDIQLTSALLQQPVILSLSITSWVEHEKASSIPLWVPFSRIKLRIFSVHPVLWQRDYIDDIILPLIFQYFIFPIPCPNGSQSLSGWINPIINSSSCPEAVRLWACRNRSTLSLSVLECLLLLQKVFEPFL